MPASESSASAKPLAFTDPPLAWLAWSSGKDSLWALHLARRHHLARVVGLLTTVTEAYGRVTMHAVRKDLLRAQAAALGLPLHIVEIPTPCSDEEYGRLMAVAMAKAASERVTHVVFGDLYLGDVRAYRERQLARADMAALFPLWGADTATLADEMIADGLRAVVTCVDPRFAPPELAGRQFDREFLRQLPAGVDPCGENGEFHTCTWDGPGFKEPLQIAVGDTVERDGFIFTDVTRRA